MDQYQKTCYYVYEHIHPDTGETLYIGHGTKDRAWRSDKPFRSEEHHARLMMWMETMDWTPEDWVLLTHKGLTKKDACEIEREQIEKWKPCYNKNMGEKLCVLSAWGLSKAKELREEHSLSYKKIGDHLGFSTMTIWRALNGKTKNYS